MKKTLSLTCVVAAALGLSAPAHAFEPNRPVEFVVTAGPGGGTDIFARTIQAIIAKYELMKAPVVVTNKGSAGGAEGFVYAAGYEGDPYKLASRLQELAYRIGAVPAFNCKSGKDRTGQCDVEVKSAIMLERMKKGDAPKPNAVLTPHIGSAVFETRRAMAQLVLDNLSLFFREGTVLTPVPA